MGKCTNDRPTPVCLVSLDDTFTGPKAETRNARQRDSGPPKEGSTSNAIEEGGERRETRETRGKTECQKKQKKREDAKDVKRNERQWMTSEGVKA
jgi:hypothetical protein